MWGLETDLVDKRQFPITKDRTLTYRVSGRGSARLHAVLVLSSRTKRSGAVILSSLLIIPFDESTHERRVEALETRCHQTHCRGHGGGGCARRQGRCRP